MAKSELQGSVVMAANDMDWSLGSVFSKSVLTNTTITFSNVGESKVVMLSVRNTSGSAITLTLPAGLFKDANMSLTVDAGKINIYTFARSNGTTQVTSVPRLVNV